MRRNQELHAHHLPCLASPKFSAELAGARRPEAELPAAPARELTGSHRALCRSPAAQRVVGRVAVAATDASAGIARGRIPKHCEPVSWPRPAYGWLTRAACGVARSGAGQAAADLNAGGARGGGAGDVHLHQGAAGLLRHEPAPGACAPGALAPRRSKVTFMRRPGLFACVPRSQPREHGQSHERAWDQAALLHRRCDDTAVMLVLRDCLNVDLVFFRRAWQLCRQAGATELAAGVRAG